MDIAHHDRANHTPLDLQDAVTRVVRTGVNAHYAILALRHAFLVSSNIRYYSSDNLFSAFSSASTLRDNSGRFLYTALARWNDMPGSAG